MRHNRTLEILIVTALFCLLGMIYTFPLACYFGKGMPYSHHPAQGYEVVPLVQGDYLQLYYKLWLFKDAVHGKTPFFGDPYQFSVREGGGKASAQFLPLSLVFLVFSLWGDVFAYNALVLLSFGVAGLAGYLLLQFYTRSRTAAFVGGIIFSLAPFRLAQLLGGHPNGFLFFLIPLAVYFLEQAFSKGSPKYGVFSGLCILSVAPLELHLVYYLFLFLSPLMVLRAFLLIFIDKERGRLRGALPVLAFMLLSVLCIFLTRHGGLDSSIAGGGRSLSEVRLFSPTAGDIVKRTNSEVEKFVYLGIVPFALGMVGLLTSFSGRRRGKGAKSLTTVIWYSLVVVVTYILCLGPNLRHVFPLYQFLYRHLPYFNYPRSPARIAVLTFLGLSVLAGFAVRKMQDWGGKKGRTKAIVAVGLVLAIFIDYFPARPVGISLVPGEREVYTIVKENIGEGRLLELPIWPGDTAWSSLYLYNITRTRARMINGYSSMVPREYVEGIFRPLYNLDFGEMRPEQYSLLRRLNVKYVIMHNEAYPGKVSPYPFSFALGNLKNSRYVELVREEGPLWLFRLLDAPSPAPEQVFSQSSVMGTVYEAERFPHRGRIQKALAGNSFDRVVAGDITEDSEGYLVYGIYRTFPTGRYKAVFRLGRDDTLGPETAVARIEVATRKGREIIEQETVKAKDLEGSDTYQDFVLPFDLKEPRRLEFRVYFPRKANVFIDHVYVLFADQEDPCFLYEAEDFFHIGQIVSDPQSSGGHCLYSNVSAVPREYMNRGPNRIYPPGKYDVCFRLKVDRMTEDEVARIEVTADRRRVKLAARDIRGIDFPDVGAFEEFMVTLDLEVPTAVEFLVFFHKQVDLWFDKVEVARRGDGL